MSYFRVFQSQRRTQLTADFHAVTYDRQARLLIGNAVNLYKTFEAVSDHAIGQTRGTGDRAQTVIRDARPEHADGYSISGASYDRLVIQKQSYAVWDRAECGEQLETCISRERLLSCIWSSFLVTACDLSFAPFLKSSESTAILPDGEGPSHQVDGD